MALVSAVGVSSCRLSDAFVTAMRIYGIPEEFLSDIQAVHWAVHQARPGGGAVRVDLPG